MEILTTTVARIIFALPFGIFGVMHFMGAKDMGGMVPSFIPGGVFWIYLTGAALVAACISIIIQKMAKLSCLLLALMLLLFILTMHIPGLMNEMTMQMSMMSLLKDMALMGGALTYAGIFAKEEA
ncbi:MAG: DoxX family protein [Cytophagales bacterium]|nr:DoxX family protein [Cytophagales bacterium]